MGSRGPAPTPRAILRARGSWRAKAASDPVSFGGEPTAPEWLDGEARAEWDRVTGELRSAGLLAAVDRALLAIYSDTWAALVDIEQRISKLKRVEDGIVKGLFTTRNRAVRQLLALADRFGFSPAARARLKTPAKKEPSDATKGRFFRPGS